MKMARIALLFALGCFSSTIFATTRYRQELEDFKNSPDYTFVFNDEADPTLRTIHRDLHNYKGLSPFQMFVRFAFAQALIVTPTTMPKLYAYTDEICKKAKVKTPTIFINIDSGLFNAAAQKLLMSSGAIIIGQELIRKSSDDVLEGVIAHEIGHIKHNHINKLIGLQLATLSATVLTMYKLGIIFNFKRLHPLFNKYLTGILWGQTANLISSCMVNKKFEREADEFAYKAVQKGEGLKEFFEILEERDQKKEQEFMHTQQLLNQNKVHPTIQDLQTRYTMAYWTRKISRWLYYNTPMGAHPSHKERIEAVQKYLDTQKQDDTAPAPTPLS